MIGDHARTRSPGNKRETEETISLVPNALEFRSAIDGLSLHHLQISCGLDICVFPRIFPLKIALVIIIIINHHHHHLVESHIEILLPVPLHDTTGSLELQREPVYYFTSSFLSFLFYTLVLIIWCHLFLNDLKQWSSFSSCETKLPDSRSNFLEMWCPAKIHWSVITNPDFGIPFFIIFVFSLIVFFFFLMFFGFFWMDILFFFYLDHHLLI